MFKTCFSGSNVSYFKCTDILMQISENDLLSNNAHYCLFLDISQYQFKSAEIKILAALDLRVEKFVAFKDVSSATVFFLFQVN